MYSKEQTIAAFDPELSAATRGFGEDEAKLTAALVCDVLDRPGDAQIEAEVRERVARLCSRFPVCKGT